MKEFKEIQLRAIDCENLGFQLTFVNYIDAESRERCKDNARKIAEVFVSNTSANDLFDREPQLSAPQFGTEPSLRKMLRYYYRTGLDLPADDAEKFVDLYLAEITKVDNAG